MFSAFKLYDWLFLIALVLSLVGWFRTTRRYERRLQDNIYLRTRIGESEKAFLQLISHILDKQPSLVMSVLDSKRDYKVLSATALSDIASALARYSWFADILTTDETINAIFISRRLPARSQPSDLNNFLTEQLAQKLVVEVRASTQLSFASCMDSIKVLEDFRTESSEWHDAHRGLIILAAERAQEIDEVEALYTTARKNVYSSEIRPVLRKRLRDLVTAEQTAST